MEEIKIILRDAAQIGCRDITPRDRNGLLAHIIEGRDIRAGALIGLALHLEKHGAFPQPPRLKRCRLCGDAVNPVVYGGHRYCSDSCRRKAALSDRSRLVNCIQTKSRRMVGRGTLLEGERRALLQAIGEETSLKGTREIARRYGVDATPGGVGRPLKGKPRRSGGGAARTGESRGPFSRS